MHPGVGPAAEAEALYVNQLRLPDRVSDKSHEFVLWDVGLGAGANALTALRSIRNKLRDNAISTAGQPMAKRVRVISFDRTDAALVFALQHAEQLGYIAGYESEVAALLKRRRLCISDGSTEIEWTLEVGDFPAMIGAARDAPDAIMFDPHSLKNNPAMWTIGVFGNLFRRIDSRRSCVLATYTRSTMARVAMLLGGFFVGVGHPSGLKEETTVAANRIDQLMEPLDRRWLERARRSQSAEPLRSANYRQEPLTAETWEQLRRHPQFGEK